MAVRDMGRSLGKAGSKPSAPKGRRTEWLATVLPAIHLKKVQQDCWQSLRWSPLSARKGPATVFLFCSALAGSVPWES